MSLDFLLLIASALAILATLSTRLAQKFGVPALVLFVGIGMLAGSSGPGGLYFDDYLFSLNAGLVALALILFSGGLDTDVRLFRASLLPAGLLATVGVGLKALLLGLAAWTFTPLDFLPGLLLGAVLAPTDAAAVFSVLKGRGIAPRLRGLLEAESGTNDPVSIYLTLALATALTTGGMSAGSVLQGIVVQLSLGAVLGVAFGYGLMLTINRMRVTSFGLYPVLALSGGLLAYAVTNLLGGSGFLAIYLTGMVLGNRRTANQQSIRTFMDSAAWGAQIAMFLLLGLLVFPDRLVGQLPEGLLMTAVLLLLARPLSVIVSIYPLGLFSRRYRFSWREQVLLSWAGLKGAVPIILAIVPLLTQVPSGDVIFNLVFVAVILGTIVQGSTIVPLAKWLKVTSSEPPEPPMRLELGGFAPLYSAVLDVFLEADTPAVGRSVREIDLPENMVIAAIYRNEKLVTPRGSVRFEAGDHVFIITEGSEVAPLPHELQVAAARRS